MSSSVFHTREQKMSFFLSCTDSLHILPGSSSESHTTTSDGACNFSNIEVEEDIHVKEEGFIALNEEVDLGIKQEEIPEANFPDIKSEPDESCTDSLHILPGSSSESHTTSDGACSFSNIEVEEDIDVKEEGFIALNEEVDLGIKQEEIPEANYPDIKSEPDESRTDSLHILPGSSSETSDGVCNFSNVEVEEYVDVIEEGFISVNEEADIGIKQGKIPEYLNFPDIKTEPDEGTFSGTFSEQGTVKQHQVIRTVERTYGCDVCNKTFSERSSLKKHQHVHTGERPYGCDVCNKTFKRLGHLKVHQRVHTGERPYGCNVCNKTFKKLEHLKVHQLVHTGERPYGCNVCNKTFRQLEHLKAHQYVHTGERPYHCDVCNKTFSDKGKLKRHQRVHTGEHPYRCDVCDKTFSDRSILKVHQHGHTGECPYFCDGCGKTFSRKFVLKRHLLSCSKQKS